MWYEAVEGNDREIGQVGIHSLNQTVGHGVGVGEVERSWSEQDLRAIQLPVGEALVQLAIEAVDDTIVSLALADPFENAIHGRTWNQLQGPIPLVRQVDEPPVLNAVLQDCDPLPVKTFQCAQHRFMARVDVGPGVKDGLVPELKTLGAFLRIGNVGHDVDFTGFQQVQAVGPGAGNVGDAPAEGLR